MRKESYYPSGEMFFKDVQRVGCLDSNINENYMVGTTTHQHSPKTTQDQYRANGLANSKKPLQPDVNTHSTSENNNSTITTRRNVPRSTVYNAPYSEIYNMVVMKISF